jgi:hypothetical protein
MRTAISPTCFSPVELDCGFRAHAFGVVPGESGIWVGAIWPPSDLSALMRD